MSKNVFVFGIFDLVHQGHYRLFNFSRSLGDTLTVGLLNNPNESHSRVTQDERIKYILETGLVDHVLVVKNKLNDFIKDKKPTIIVKGIEFDQGISENEVKAVESYGGRVVYWSDSSIGNYEINEEKNSKVADYCKRNKISSKSINNLIKKIRRLKGVVIGDAILDEYVNCEIVGISREDPTIVVTPSRTERFIGGAGIIASHAAQNIKQCGLFTKIGRDEGRAFVQEKLLEYGVENFYFFDEDEYKTTIKRRYITDEKTQLRVNNFDNAVINNRHVNTLMEKLENYHGDIDFLIFSDFSLGTISQNLIKRVVTFCKKNKIFMAADSQVSSKIGDVSKFFGVNYICPTEVEARISLHDNINNLAVISRSLTNNIKADHCVITLGKEGIFIYSRPTNGNKKTLDNLPALSNKPIDISGAGDIFLLYSSCALAAGANIWEASLLGSLASKYQVEQVGNVPVKLDQIRL